MKRVVSTNNDSPVKEPMKRGPKEILYDPEYHPPQAFIVCSEFGADYNGVANTFGIQIGKLREWRQSYPELQAAILSGRDLYNTEKAEVSLLKRVMGYEYEEKKYVRTFMPFKKQPKDDEDTTGIQFRLVRNKPVYGEYKLVLQEKYVKHKPADVNALTLWLVNRMSERWRGIGKSLKISGSIKSEKTLRLIAEKRLSQLNTLELKELEMMRDILSRAETGQDIKTKIIDMTPRKYGKQKRVKVG